MCIGIWIYVFVYKDLCIWFVCDKYATYMLVQTNAIKWYHCCSIIPVSLQTRRKQVLRHDNIYTQNVHGESGSWRVAGQQDMTHFQSRRDFFAGHEYNKYVLNIMFQMSSSSAINHMYTHLSYTCTAFYSALFRGTTM